MTALDPAALADLAPVERLAVELADGTPLAQAAIRAGIRSADATREARAFGWPDLAKVRANVADLLSPIAQEPPVPDQPAPDVMATAIHEADHAAALADLQLIEKLTTNQRRATLTMPLLRLVGADGRDITVTQAVVEVELLPALVLSYADGGADALGHQGPLPVVCYVTKVLTDEGRDAVRELAELLDGGQ